MLHGQTRYNLPSRFLDELPERLLKWITPRAGRLPSGWGAARAGDARSTPRAAQSPTASFGTTQDAGGFRIGQSVVHAKFGNGVIVDAKGRGADAHVQVNFGRNGVKWLALGVAKLQAA